ncbi:MAG: C4-type zinc ribbon domain-containing protein [Bacteroidales bacterium]|nr:C4-type zinc ribbon domain-containing protein [Bacteroidales bacterium]
MAKKKETVTPEEKVEKSVDNTVVYTTHENTVVVPDVTIEKKLESLYGVQLIDSKIDNIRIVRGELPLEVQDLEDAIIGMETRIGNYKMDIIAQKSAMEEQQNNIKEAEILMKKYDDQRMNVRNNREYDSLTKEIEYQSLDIQLSNKKIADAEKEVEKLTQNIEIVTKNLAKEREDLAIKKSELENIVIETENEEKILLQLLEEHKQFIEERLLAAYTKIRKTVRNGLAVVSIERDACAGCFNKIPPQRQLDIKIHKKIIVCESCGRILVDNDIASEVQNKIDEELTKKEAE